MNERWLPVVGYEGLYSVSNKGRVRSEPRAIGGKNGTIRQWKGGILKTKCLRLKGSGRRYPSVALWRNNKMVKVRVQYVVAEAWLGPRPSGLHVLHWDDDPINNAVSNLRYGTHAENKADEVRNSTHCRSGKHEWTEANTYKRPDTGTRICRGCIADNRRKKEGTMKKVRPIVRVIVEEAGKRKGWHWRQVTGNGATGAVSPKTYDTKALAHRAGQRQVDLLNYPYTVVLPVGETPVLPEYAAVLVP